MWRRSTRQAPHARSTAATYTMGIATFAAIRSTTSKMAASKIGATATNA